jgi:predicted DNA-binding protein (MmcQ/YjbR family)
MPRKNQATNGLLKELREFGLSYPGAHTKSPWPGHLDLAVKDKTFAYLSIEGEPFKISCKLPSSSAAALMLPFATPTAYGLGKSGWVTAQFPEGEMPPKDLLKDWIDESYRAQAPKKLIASLTASPRIAEAGAKSRSKSARSAKPIRASRGGAKIAERATKARKGPRPR